MINVGMLGLGHMGLLHLRNTRFMDDIKVVAAADKSKKSLAEAKSYGIKNVYKNFRDLLNLGCLDAVVITLPHFLHEESAVLSAERGLHIFIEKPLARSVQECKRIKQAVQKNNVKLAVGHNYRLFDNIQKLKTELETGRVGEVEIANIEHFANGPFAHPLEPRPVQDWWLDVELSGGGVLLDDGSHIVDLFRWLFPDPELLYANLGHRYNLALEDSAILILRSRRTSTKGIISMGWFQKVIYPNFNFRINLQGTANWLSTDDFLPKNFYLHAMKSAVKNILLKAVGKKINPLSYTYYFTSYYKELQTFFDSINGDVKSYSLATVDDGLEVVRIIERAYQLAKSK